MGNKKKDGQEKSVLVVRAEEAIFNAVLVGRSPLVINRMSEKAKHELLWPRRKTTAYKEQTMKHDPIQEFRDSIHRLESPSEPTLLGIPSASPKLACAAAALDTPGAKKAQVGRLTWVFGNYLPVYGMPKIYMTVVRMADMNRTPDIRTRCIVPEWAVRVRIRYVTPILNESSMATLLVSRLSAVIADCGLTVISRHELQWPFYKFRYRGKVDYESCGDHFNQSTVRENRINASA